MSIYETFKGVLFLERDEHEQEAAPASDFGPRFGNRVASRRFLGVNIPRWDAPKLDDCCAAGCG